MHIRFAEADQNFITSQAQHGYYASETEVVRDAVRRLREQKEALQSPFYQAVMKGHRQIEQGFTVPFNKELMEQIDREAVAQAERSEAIAYDRDAIRQDDEP